MSGTGTDSSPNDHTPLDRTIATLAARRHDLVTRAELLAVGLTARGISKRVERRVLHQRYRGVPEPLVNTKLLGYEVDFLWPEVWLNVEVDGAQHNTPPARRADAARDRILGAAGYTVLRFPEHLVKERPDEVLRAVSAWVASRGLQRAA